MTVEQAYAVLIILLVVVAAGMIALSLHRNRPVPKRHTRISVDYCNIRPWAGSVHLCDRPPGHDDDHCCRCDYLWEQTP